MSTSMVREPTMTKILGILALGFAALCTTACNKDKDKPEVGTTTTTSSEVEPTNRPVGQPTMPKDDYLAAVRREQLVLRGRIDDQLRAIEKKLAVKSLDAKTREELLEKRETLRADATVVVNADERGWDELKAVVEHDLEGPPQM
jgi:hypothetical protein